MSLHFWVSKDLLPLFLDQWRLVFISLCFCSYIMTCNDDFVSAGRHYQTLTLTGRPIRRTWRGSTGSDYDAEEALTPLLPSLRQTLTNVSLITQHWPGSHFRFGIDEFVCLMYFYMHRFERVCITCCRTSAPVSFFMFKKRLNEKWMKGDVTNLLSQLGTQKSSEEESWRSRLFCRMLCCSPPRFTNRLFPLIINHDNTVRQNHLIIT